VHYWFTSTSTMASVDPSSAEMTRDVKPGERLAGGSVFFIGSSFTVALSEVYPLAPGNTRAPSGNHERDRLATLELHVNAPGNAVTGCGLP